MTVWGVIPARFGSTRLPGKPLLEIGGRPLLAWVLEGVRSSRRITKFIVATDHEGIAELARSCGVEAVMTDPNLPSGSDRVWAAVCDKPCDVVVNIQGDEPLIEGEVLDRLVECFDQNPGLEMATLARAMTLEDLTSPNTAKIVLNRNNEALYFSRLPLPYSRDNASQFAGLEGSLKHIGIYAYSTKFLGQFCRQKPVLLEQAEGLEQLRALYLGARIQVATVDHQSWGVDTPDDVAKVEALLKSKKETT